MLYVFQMDIGQMLTFDTSLLMDTVSRLQQEIARTTGISVDKQILLVSGGHSLKLDQKVMTYGAGTDTNPVYLFSKLAIESQEPPLVRSFGLPRDKLSALKEGITEALSLKPSFEAVAKRTKLATELRENANKMLSFCNNEFREQHLQHQGWGTVVANLEEIAQAMQKTEAKFTKTFTAFLPTREKHFSMLENFSETLELLERIPLLKALKDREVEDPDFVQKSVEEGVISFVASTAGPSTLLEWIITQGHGQSVEMLQHKCYEDLRVFNSEMFERCNQQVQELLSVVISDPHHMKELVGIERRLSELEKRLNEAKKIAKEQNDMAQGFLNHKSRLTTTPDAATILPDLCKSHEQQLRQMQERQQRMEALQNNFRKSKQEMSTNIYQRLGWVMHVETQISKLDSDLIYHMKMLRILECNLELLNQVKAAPQVYADMVVEAVRRKMFSSKFLQWAEALVEDSGQLYKAETERRKEFARKLGEHFLLDTLFRGFEDMPPNFATQSPQSFDVALPDLTPDDVALLRRSVPELEEYLSISIEAGSFPVSLLSKTVLESPRLQMITPQSQSSQTEWNEEIEAGVQPCVIKATEAPPTKFSLPELQESMATEYLPAVSSLTETMRVAITSELKPSCEPKMVKAANSSESSDSAAVSGVIISESGVAVHSVKTQTKTNSTHTDSTSPLSSNEFATADFYFEDSMPSPMADSPLAKKDGKKLEGSSDSEMVISLQAELAEKVAMIHELEQKLKVRGAQLSDSATLVGTTDLSDQALTSDSGGAISSSGSNVVMAETKSDGTAGDGGKIVKGDENSTNVEVSDSQASSVPNEEALKIRKLEWELELANGDLTKFKESLFESETKLSELQDQSARTIQEKEGVILDLQNQLKNLQEELLKAEKLVESKSETNESLEKALSESKTRQDSLEQEVKKGEENLGKIRSQLVEFREKLKVEIPSLRQTLKDLRATVVSSKSEVDTAVSSAMGLVEQQVSSFHTSVLADVNAEHTQETDALRAEIQQLKCDLNKLQSDTSEKVVQLNNLNEELTSQMAKHQKDHAAKCDDLRKEHEEAVKEIETKHALEMELELDRCRAELRENVEEAERNVERLNKMKDDLNRELEKVRKTAEREKAELETSHKSQVEEIERKNMKDKEAAIQSSQKLEAKMEEKERNWSAQVKDLEAKLVSVQSSLTAEKEHAIAALREQLTSEQEVITAEITQQMEAQKSDLTQVLEEKQLQHAEKLTELKTHFDLERESLIRELNKYKNWERDQAETQTDCSLTHTNTQTEVELMTDAMTNSETQTGLELLADVISLTSSASYGSEEMIAHKQPSIVTDEKESKDATDITNKLQQTIDDLNVQLANAQEKIAMLEDEISMLKDNRTMSTSGSGTQLAGSRLSELSQSQYQEMMQSSNTGASFMIMDKEPPSPQANPADEKAAKAKDQKIAQLEKKLMEMSMTASEREVTSDKVSIRGCDKGDLVLLCLDERHDQYVVFTVGTNLHFLHSESLECLGLKTGADASCRKSWILAEVVDKEYCLAKKPNNRFRVPQGTCFYRVKCKPWKSECELPRQEIPKHAKVTKPDHGVGARPKKMEKR